MVRGYFQGEVEVNGEKKGARDEMTGIRLGEGLTLPPDIATQTLLIVGKRGSGKSTTCVRLAEQFFKAKVPFVVVDPSDTWYGLKSGKDGKSPGIGVHIFGGRHEDLPLESASGQLVADIIIDHRISCVLSIKHFSGRERGRFVSDLADRLFRRNTDPLHLFLEEAHEVAPQNPFKGEEEMLGRVTRIWKLGRSSGLGGSAITQRPASLSKNITTQAEILIVHRMLGPQDVAAVREWIKYHGESEEVLSQLSELKTGEAWIWAPDFPEDKPIGLKRVKIFDRETFDSSATPKAGQHRIEPKDLAPVDIDALRVKMAATIERAKQEDPRELRKKISELERQLRTVPAPVQTVETKTKEIPILKDDQISQLYRTVEKLKRISDKLAAPIDEMAKQSIAITEAIKKYSFQPVSTTRPLYNKTVAQRPNPILDRRIVLDDESPHSLRLGERRMLNVLCRWYPARLTKAQLATLSRLRVTSGTFSAYYGILKRANLIDEASNGIQVSELGYTLTGGKGKSPQTTDEIIDMWRNSLRAGERKLLDILVKAYPDSIPKEELAERAELTASSGTFGAYLGTLRRNGLAETRDGKVKAGEALFLKD
jgi:hypothetical protein